MQQTNASCIADICTQMERAVITREGFRFGLQAFKGPTSDPTSDPTLLPGVAQRDSAQPLEWSCAPTPMVILSLSLHGRMGCSCWDSSPAGAERHTALGAG